MAIKNVVKVMNFHSLLRVDKSKRKANLYFDVENQLKILIKKVLYNQNLRLDKKIVNPDSSSEILSIYIGNDYGFCGDFNVSINKEVREDINPKITIGKKINKNYKTNVVIDMTKEEFFTNYQKINDFIYNSIKEKKYREIYVIYNHYYSVSKLGFVKKKIYPIDLEKLENDDDIDFDEDFVFETKIDDMLNNFISLYICYEIKICEMNSYAAENIMRQNITREALKRIDEKEEESKKAKIKERKQKEFKKIIDNYRKDVV